MTGDPAPAAPASPERPAWEECLGTGAAPTPRYFHAANTTVLEVIERAPRRILELGCSAGGLAALIRERYPGVHHVGIEMNAPAAAVARGRLARVIEARLEDVDFAAEGIGPGTIDTFVACDVLEHLQDPWRTLLRARPLLTEDAQVIVSIPNVRNLQVVGELLHEGTWRYARDGLLDVTHLRFFALRDIVRMLEETGYRIGRVKANLDARYERIVQENRDRPAVTLQVGRVRLEHLTQEELTEYCTLQYVVRAHPVAASAAA